MQDQKEAAPVCRFNVNDRVKRKNNIGCCGVVKEVRRESINSASSPKDESIFTVWVNWDNGSCSAFSPDSLQHA